MSSRLLWTTLILGLAVFTAFIVSLSNLWLVIGASAGNWAYRYVQPFPPHALVAGVLAAAAAASALRLPLPEPGREWRVVLLWLLIGLALQAFLRTLTPFSLEAIYVSDGANSFHSVTGTHDASTVLSEFGRVRRDAPLHAQSNMPGKLMLLYALRVLTVRPDILPWLVVIVSNLGGVLLYLIVRDLFDDRTVALYSLVLYLFVPAKLVFFPLMNTVTVVPLLLCLWLHVRWLLTGRTLWPGLLGAGLYLLVFFEPLPLVMGLLFAGLALRSIALGQLAAPRFALQACVMLLAFVVTAEAVQAVLGFNLAHTVVRLREHAVAFNTAEGRPYGVWLWGNLWEFVVGTGVLPAVLFPVALGLGAAAGGTRRARAMHPLTVICASLVAVLAVTDLIGINRGEVVRLWIFLACFFQIPAAYLCSREPRRTAIMLVTATSLVHAALGTAMVGFIVP